MTIKLEHTGFFSKLDWDAFTQRLNDAGKEGWEMVALQSIGVFDGKTSYMVAVLKRPTPQAPPA